MGGVRALSRSIIMFIKHVCSQDGGSSLVTEVSLHRGDLQRRKCT